MNIYALFKTNIKFLSIDKLHTKRQHKRLSAAFSTDYNTGT